MPRLESPDQCELPGSIVVSVDRTDFSREDVHVLHHAEDPQQILLSWMPLFDLDLVRIIVIKVHDDLAVGCEDVRERPIDQLGDVIHPPGGGLAGFTIAFFWHL
jgi:hypothetical protein